MLRIFLISFLALGTLVSAQDQITISGPAVVQPNAQTLYTVSGLTEEDLKSSVVKVEPSKGTFVLQLKSGWSGSGSSVILFSATTPGKYTIIIGTNLTHNEWRKHLNSAVIGAKDANVEASLLTQLATLNANCIQKYPTKSQAVLVEVAGSVPPTPVPPPGPTPTPEENQAYQLIVIRNQKLATVSSVMALLDLQVKYQKGQKPEMFLVDHTDTSNVIREYVDKIPQGAGFPYFFLINKNGKPLEQGTVTSANSISVLIDKYK